MWVRGLGVVCRWRLGSGLVVVKGWWLWVARVGGLDRWGLRWLSR